MGIESGMFDKQRLSLPADDLLCVFLLHWEAGRENTSGKGPRRNLSYYVVLLPEIRSAKPGSESLPLSQWRFLEKGVVGKTVCMERFVGANPGWLESCKLFCTLRRGLNIPCIKWLYPSSMGRMRKSDLDSYRWWRGQISFLV